MLLYQRASIPQWTAIQEKFSYLETVRTGNEWIYLLDSNEISKLNELLPVCPGRKIKSVLAFSQGPHAVQEIHVDGYSASRTRASNVALNIPIKSHGKMTWYKGHYSIIEASHPSKVKYLKINWHGDSEPYIDDAVVIDSPTVVRVNVPHSVTNLCDDSRIVISIRYSPDIILG